MFTVTGLPKPVRHALKWDAISAALGGLSSGAIFPFLGVILRRDLGGSAYLVALLGASWAIGNLFSPLLAHHVRDRVKLPYAVWPPAISRACFLLMPLALGTRSFVAITVAGFAFGSLATPAYSAVIRDAYPVERRGQLMGFVRVLFVGGSMVGALVGGALLQRLSYRWVFPGASLVGIAGVAAFSRIGVSAAPDGSAPPLRRISDAFRIAAADRLFRTYSTAFFFYALGNLILSPVYPVFQVDVLRISNQWVAYLSSTASGLSMVGYLFWGRLLDRRGPFSLVLSVLAVAALVPITYALAQDVPVLLIAAAAQGLATAGGDLGYVNAAMRFAPRQLVVSYAAVFAFLQALRGIPGPFVGAALSEWLGLRPVFLITLGLWVVSATLMVAGRRQERSPSAHG